MDNIEKQLKEYEQQCNITSKKIFENFHQMEIEYCNLINLGNTLRKRVIDYGCDQESLNVLQNKTRDISKLNNKYKSLLNVIKYTHILYQKYIDYIPELLNKEQYDEAINIYNQLFNFTSDYSYKQKIANIHFKVHKNSQLAYKIYKEIEPFMCNNKNYWWEFSDIYKALNDIYNCVASIKKACIIEINEIDKDSSDA